MKLLYQDQLRKIKLNLFNFISLSLLVIIISLSYTAVKSSVNRLEENYDTYLKEQQLEDFYFSMGKIDVNYLSGTATVKLCRELDLQLQCALALANPDDAVGINNLNVLLNEKIEERPDLYEALVDSYISDFEEDYDFTIEKKKIVNITEGKYIYKFMTITETIDIPYIIEGNLPLNDNEIAIFPEFAKANNLKIGDYYPIEGNPYLITAFFYSPEFALPIFSMNTLTFDEEVQTLVLCNDYTIEHLNQYVYVKYLVLGDLSQIFDEFTYATMQSADLSLLGKNMQMVGIIMPSDINYRVISLPMEVDNANAFTDIFLSLFIVFIVILLIVFMKRYIEKNEDDIHTLHALGYTNHEITKSLLVFPVLVSFMSVIGYLLGLVASKYLFTLYSSRYYFPKADFTIYPEIFKLSVLLPIIFLIVVNYLFIFRSVAKKKKTNQRKQLKLFRFTPLKTILTTFVLFITINIMIIFGLSGNSMFSAFLDETVIGNNYYQMINLQYMTNEPVSNEYEPYTRVRTSIITVNNHSLDEAIHTTVFGIDPTNHLKLLIDNDIENNQLLNDGIIISEYLSKSANLKIADTVTFLIGNEEVTLPIVGISNELIASNFFMDKTLLNSLYGLDNTYYKGLYVTDDLYDSDYVVTKINYRDSLEQFSSMLNTSSIIINYLVILSSILSLFIFSLVLISYFNENRINIAILKSLGYNNKEINLKYLLNIYIILIISFIISIPITKTLLDMLLTMLMQTVGVKLILDIRIINVITGFLILNTIFFMVIVLTNKYYDKISIAEIMKKNIN